MEALVSLLDKRCQENLAQVCLGLDEFRTCGLHITEFPHFSYQVAQHYDLTRLIPRLESIARRFSPLQVRAGGIGVFTGAAPIIFIPVVRTPELSRLHQALWEALASLGTEAVRHYHPAAWIPHITLARGNLTHAMLPDIMRWLGQQTIEWDIAVDALTLIYERDGARGVHVHAAFTRGNDATPAQSDC